MQLVDLPAGCRRARLQEPRHRASDRAGALAQEQTESVEFHRTLQADRLDAMLHSVWDAAEAGDLDAVNTAVRIVMAQARIYGVIGTGKRKRVKCTQPQTVVLMENDCRERARPDHT